MLWKYEPPKKPDGKWQKVPYQPNGYKASTTNRHTWSTFETCRAVYEQGGYDGVGFVFDGEVGPDGTCLVGIDLDRCIDKRKIQHLALERIKRLGTYTEASPSGTGLHLIARTEPVESVKTKEVELYTTARYFTFTGRKWGEESQIRIATAEVRALVAELKAKAETQHKPSARIEPRRSLPAPRSRIRNWLKGSKTITGMTGCRAEQKDEVVDHALGVIVAFLEESGGHTNDQWYRLTTAVARSGAPNAEDIFVKHASSYEEPGARGLPAGALRTLPKGPATWMPRNHRRHPAGACAGAWCRFRAVAAAGRGPTAADHLEPCRSAHFILQRPASPVAVRPLSHAWGGHGHWRTGRSRENGADDRHRHRDCNRHGAVG